MLAELGEVTLNECPGGCGENDLAAVAGGRDAGGAVQLPPGIAFACRTELPRVQPIRTMTGPEPSTS